MANVTEVYEFRFHRGMFNTPILFNLGKKFRLTVNVRRAVLNEDAGWAEVALAGSEDEVKRAIADLQTTGVITTGPITDLVAPDLGEYVPTSVGRGT